MPALVFLKKLKSSHFKIILLIAKCFLYTTNVFILIKKIQYLTHRRGELEESLEDINIEEVTSIEEEIVRATEASRKLLQEVYSVNA